MKKVLLFVIALFLLLSATITTNAADTTTLTTTVPDASYTLKIPADLDIPYRSTETQMELLTVSTSIGFGEGKDLKVTLTFDALSSDTVQTTIPYALEFRGNKDSINTGVSVHSGEFVTFLGLKDGTIQKTPHGGGQNFTECIVMITEEAWNAAQAGTYTSTITYTAEVV